MISPENENLDKTKLKNLINFLHILFYSLWAIFSIIMKN